MNKKLKILLISPKGQFLSKNPEFFDFIQDSREMQTILHYWNGMGAALPTIAGLTPGIHEISIIDENFEEIDFDSPVDIVGITAMTQQANRGYEVAGEFIKRGRYVVMGGIHASVMPDEVLHHANSVFVGEADNSWPAFINDYINGSPKRMYSQSEYGPVQMNRIPVPRYDLVAKYKFPIIWIQTTRGCPYDCEFCAASRIYGFTYKNKDEDQIINEIKEVRKYWKFSQIGFADDNMFVNRKFSINLLRRFSELNFSWLAQTDISVAEDTEFIRQLRESGCRILFIGLESVSKKNLAGINKNKWKEKKYDNYAKYIDIIQKKGIGVYGSFIIGFEEDDHTTADALINFINENNIMGTQVTILTPFPGSRLRNRLEENNRIVTHDWDYYTGWNSVVRHDNFTAEELEQSLLTIYKNIYNYDSFMRKASYFKKICADII